MNLKSFYVSWVDLLVVIVLFWGIRRGQKKGMSEESLVLLQWVTILVVAGFGYAPLGQAMLKTGVIGLLWANVFAYISLALVVILIFSGFRRSVGEKLLASEAFGSTEYYLGMMAGGVRHLLVLIACFALLHAREYTRADRDSSKKYQLANYGSDLFPGLVDVQDEVFTRSLSGQFADKYLSVMLIKPTTQSNKSIHRVNARERALDEVLQKR